MKTKIYIPIIMICTILLMTGFSDAQLSTTVTLSFSGEIVQQTPVATYTYIISISGSSYQIKDATTENIIYQSQSASQAANYAVNNIDAGESIFFSSGIYNLHGSITVTNKNNITLTFDSDSILFISNGMNAPAIMISESDNCLIQNPTIDGNAANQVLSNNYVQGIQMNSCTNCEVAGASITDVRRFGVLIQGPNTSNCGVVDSVITYCGWNGINLGGGLGSESFLYAVNNEISHCSDVGITSYGVNTNITGNYVHDMDGSTGSPDGANSQWGIADEKGGGSGIDSYNLIVENTIFNVKNGVVVTTSGAGNLNYVLVSNNDIDDCVQNGVVLCDSSFSIVELNNITNAYCGVFIYADSGTCIGNIVHGNTFANCSINLQIP